MKGSLSHHSPWIKWYVCNTQLPLCLDKLALLPVSPLTACNKEESVWYLSPLQAESQHAVMHPLFSFHLSAERWITNGHLQIMKNVPYLCPAHSYNAPTPSSQTPAHLPASLPRICYVSQGWNSLWCHVALMYLQARTRRGHSSCSTELLGWDHQTGIQNLC